MPSETQTTRRTPRAAAPAQRYLMVYNDTEIPAQHFNAIQAVPGLVISSRVFGLLVVDAPMSLRKLRATIKDLPGWTVGKETATYEPSGT